MPTLSSPNPPKKRGPKPSAKSEALERELSRMKPGQFIELPDSALPSLGAQYYIMPKLGVFTRRKHYGTTCFIRLS